MILSNGKILQVNSIYTHSNESEVQIGGIILKIVKAIFEYPYNSSTLKMWKVKKESDIIVTQPLSNVLQKMITFFINDNDKKNIYNASSSCKQQK